MKSLTAQMPKVLPHFTDDNQNSNCQIKIENVKIHYMSMIQSTNFITPHQFDEMDEMEKIKTLAYHAEKMTERQDEKFYYNLYKLGNFYIEEKIEKRPEGSFYSPSYFSIVSNISRYV
jgi:hypothetical protein